MVIALSIGKLILTPTELVCRLDHGGILRALPDDIRLLSAPPMLIADAGAVSWTLPIESLECLDTIYEFYGFTKELP